MSYKNEMKEAAQVGTILGLLASTFYAILAVFLVVGSILSFYLYSYFAPKYEQVRYDTFKQSQSYNDGMLRDLQDLRMEYVKANDEQKAAIKYIAIHRFSVYDIDRLPVDLRVFYQELSK
jgi:hypothetical protein